MAVHGIKASGKTDDEFVECGTGKTDRAARVLQGILEVLRLVAVETCQFPDAGPPEGGHIHGGCERVEAVVGADVRRRLFTSDVLLPCRQRQDEAAFPLPVRRFTHEASGQVPHKLFPARQHPQCRTAEGAGNAQTLTLPGDDVGTLASRTLQQPIGQRLGKAGDEKRTDRMGLFSRRLKVFNASEKVRRLYRDDGRIRNLPEAGKVGEPRFRKGKLQEFIAGGCEVGPDNLTVTGVDRAGKDRLFLSRDADRHQQRLGQCRRAVVMGGRGNLHSQKPGRQRLVLVDPLQRPLKHLRLIRRVGGEKLGAAQKRRNGSRDVMIVAPGPQKQQVFRGNGHPFGQLSDLPLERPFAHRRRHVQRPAETALQRNRRKEVIEIGHTDPAEHRSNVLRSVGKVTHL